jgi:hypothetical protein
MEYEALESRHITTRLSSKMINLAGTNGNPPVSGRSADKEMLEN